MNYAVINLAQSDAKTIAEKSEDPRFRKATRKMILTCSAFDHCIEPIKDFFAKSDKSNFGLVVGSVIGELESTRDFLLSWNQMKLARPLLFQNSLHNSSAGMVSLYYGLTGPVITTSHPLTLSQDSLSLAELMLSNDLCSFVFVANVETESGILGYDGPPEGAEVLLLAKSEKAKEYGLPTLNKRVTALSPIGFALRDL